jgi:hypothetical protein
MIDYVRWESDFLLALRLHATLVTDCQSEACLTIHACWRTWLRRPLQMLDCVLVVVIQTHPVLHCFSFNMSLVCKSDLLLQTCPCETFHNFYHCTNFLPINALHLNPIKNNDRTANIEENSALPNRQHP